MDALASNRMWMLISEKLEKGEHLGADFIVWNYISGAGTRKKEDCIGNAVLISKKLAEFQKNSELSEDGLKALYDKNRKVVETELAEAVSTRDRFKEEAKAVLKQVRGSKVSPVLKKGIGEMLNGYAEMLDDEIREARHKLVDFESWKKDYKIVMFSQIPYLKSLLKTAEENDKDFAKVLDSVNGCFPMPEGFGW